MNRTSILKGACVALCLIGMLVLPAAADPGSQIARLNRSVADPGLIDDLWTNHQNYRMQRFDTNVEQATGILAILDRYSIDSSGCRVTLSTITGKRADLETALIARDREKLKTVNAELKIHWKQFRKDMRDALRQHYGSRMAGTALSDLTDVAGMAGADS